VTLTGPEEIKAVRSKWRRGQIIEAALRLLDNQGFRDMTVNMLAAEAGISVGTIYQYVRNKDDILLLVIKDVLDSYREDVPRAMEGLEDPVDRLAAGFRAYCRVVDSHRAGTVLAYRESKALSRENRLLLMQLEEQTTDLLVTCLEEGIAAKILTEHDPRVVGWNLTSLAHMWSLKHWHFGRWMTVDDYAGAQLALTLSAIIPHDLRKNYRRHVTLPEADGA
jgi:AcrR family transcriptional regulator